MALVYMRDLIYHAYANRYAICSFDLVNIEYLYAVLGAAEQCRSPVILNVNDTRIDKLHFAIFMAAVERAAQQAQIPVAIQFDTTTSADALHKGIKYGCNGVGSDASYESLPVNIEKTLDLTALTHCCGIAVEGKLGYTTNNSANPDDAKTIIYSTCAHEARAYVERTHVDFLAVTIDVGSDKRRARSKLDYQRLAKINQAVRVPLVIEGYRELSDDQYFKLISHGVAKINYAATLFDNQSNEGFKQTNKSRSVASYDDYSNAVRQSVENKAINYMHLCGSAGRAAEVLMQCRTWTNVEHIIVYNTTLTNEADIQSMIGEGTKELAKIPGVRAVVAGKSIHDDSKYAYTWLIRFCSREVVEFYKEHPIHKYFADQYFRPQARDRVTTDYELLVHHEAARIEQEYYRATG